MQKMNILELTRERLDKIGRDDSYKNPKDRDIFDSRNDQQPYAKLKDIDIKVDNRYGQKIDLLDLTEGKFPEGRSMFINENPRVGDNPNRNKQHGFHFTADNCIGCHACEAACSEKNDNPAHLSFRSVGYVEGGTYPDYKRLNISMACNHCDDPVCLKGCPTKAYTKHVEYGAVLQDPDTCFGCGYCTWVCPYNAPQLDPIKGQVSKCNMCVDRLEVGLKPACVSACVGNALNFGVIENVPENREQVKAQIPGFPSPDITHPNIRFQQTRTMPNEMTRTDTMNVKYHKQEDGSFSSVVDEKQGKAKYWNLAKLSSRENPLVVFTLGSQTAMGAFAALFLASFINIPGLSAVVESAAFIPLLLIMIALQTGGLILSTMHLGKPMRFYRGFNNLRFSPVSREALGVAMFHAGLSAFTFFKVVQTWLDWVILDIACYAAGGFAVLAAALGLFFMCTSYRIKARPFWNHWQVSTTFYGTLLSLGGVLIAVVALPVLLFTGGDWLALLPVVALMMAVGLVIEGVGLIAHAKHLNVEAGEGAASHYMQQTIFGKTYIARNVSIATAAVLALVAALIGGVAGLVLISLSALLAVLALLAGRALFYVLVVPTTMPGAFFWKNKGFEEHARDIGLADMPQVGVVPDLH